MSTVTSRTDKEKSECYVQFVFGSTEYEHFDAHDDTTYPRSNVYHFLRTVLKCNTVLITEYSSVPCNSCVVIDLQDLKLGTYVKYVRKQDGNLVSYLFY